MGQYKFKLDTKMKVLVPSEYLPDDWEIDRETARKIRERISEEEELKLLRLAIQAVAAGEPLPEEVQAYFEFVQNLIQTGKAKKKEVKEKRKKYIPLEEWALKKLSKAKLIELAGAMNFNFKNETKDEIIDIILKAKEGKGWEYSSLTKKKS